MASHVANPFFSTSSRIAEAVAVDTSASKSRHGSWSQMNGIPLEHTLLKTVLSKLSVARTVRHTQRFAHDGLYSAARFRPPE